MIIAAQRCNDFNIYEYIGITKRNNNNANKIIINNTGLNTEH